MSIDKNSFKCPECGNKQSTGFVCEKCGQTKGLIFKTKEKELE